MYVYKFVASLTSGNIAQRLTNPVSPSAYITEYLVKRRLTSHVRTLSVMNIHYTCTTKCGHIEMGMWIQHGHKNGNRDGLLHCICFIHTYIIVYITYTSFLHSPSTLAGYQFLSLHLAITMPPMFTDDLDASGLTVGLS